MNTPTQVIDSHGLTGTRREISRRKRLIIREWLTTPHGQAYLASLLADRDIAVGRAAAVDGQVDPYNHLVFEESDNGRLVKSSNGNVGRERDGKAYLMTRTECETAGVQPGKGNRD